MVDAGLDLRSKTLTRLRFDVENHLQHEISALNGLVDSEAGGEPIGSRHHMALLDKASARGYRAVAFLQTLRQEGNLKDERIEALSKENEQLREAVKQFGKRKERWLRRQDAMRGRQGTQ